MKIAASFSMGRLAPKHNLNIDGIRKLSPNVTPALIKDDVVIVDNLRTGSGAYQTIDEYTDRKFQPYIDQYNAKQIRQDRRITTGYADFTLANPKTTAATGDNRPIELLLIGYAAMSIMAAVALVRSCGSVAHLILKN